MRPLWLEFPSESTLFSEQDSFMIGKALLIRPITSAAQRDTQMAFPGVDPWYSFPTYNTKITGGSKVRVSAPLEYPIVFHRGGTIIPLSTRIRRSSTVQLLSEETKITLIVALDHRGNAAGSLYLDDGVSFDYKNGAYLFSNFSFTADTLRSSSLSPSGFPQKEGIVVDSVFVVGLRRCPATIKSVDGHGIASVLDFICESGRGAPLLANTVGIYTPIGANKGAPTVLEIRKPNLKQTDNWQILLE